MVGFSFFAGGTVVEAETAGAAAVGFGVVEALKEVWA